MAEQISEDAVARIVEVPEPLMAVDFVADVLVDRTTVADDVATVAGSPGAAGNGAPVELADIVLPAVDAIDIEAVVVLVVDNVKLAEVVLDIDELAALVARSLAGMD